ncbi:hypothetical protein AB1Y20_004835 [Prymnesium parvum]|uniref:Uncharacterized protein n=1 Tax=Prymnesium parvum TaxID=97485 RepID=A0AB34IXU7_PRYPA
MHCVLFTPAGRKNVATALDGPITYQLDSRLAHLLNAAKAVWDEVQRATRGVERADDGKWYRVDGKKRV